MDHFGRTHVLRLVRFIATPPEDTQLFLVTHRREISFVQTAVWRGGRFLSMTFLSMTTTAHGKCGSMKFHTEYLTLHTKTKRAYVHLTPQVESALKKSGIKDGMILVSAMHITAGVYVNDNESGLIKDIDAWLETLAPFRENYLHHQTGEDNGDAHLKSLIIHHEVIVPVTNGKLDFGPWQQIFYAEFDGQRDKRVIIKVMGE
jgi:secondary thiamine-phosphate synthase enzyme